APLVHAGGHPLRGCPQFPVLGLGGDNNREGLLPPARSLAKAADLLQQIPKRGVLPPAVRIQAIRVWQIVLLTWIRAPPGDQLGRCRGAAPLRSEHNDRANPVGPHRKTMWLSGRRT